MRSTRRGPNKSDFAPAAARVLVLAVACACGVADGCRGDLPPDSGTAGSDKKNGPVAPDAFHPPPVEMVDIAEPLGIAVPLAEPPRPMRILETFGSGSGLFDFDADGWLDVMVVDRPSVRLYRNLNGAGCEEVTEPAGLRLVEGYWLGCAAGDFDNDGFIDLLLTGYRRLALLRNMGGDGFLDVTQECGLDGSNFGQWGSGAALMDLDNDGWLDLVVLNYAEFGPDSQQYCRHGVTESSCPPMKYPPVKGRMFRNTGQGAFAAVPPSDGMDQTGGRAMVLGFTDVEPDGKLDFYIGNDGVEADFLRNQGGMRFENDALRSGLATNRQAVMAAMGADFGDYNRDGLLDLIVTDFSKVPFALFRCQGDGLYESVGNQVGISEPTITPLGFGEHWIDLDNDGWLDIAFINGHVYESAPEIAPGETFQQPMMLFYNRQGTGFVDLVPLLGGDPARPIVGRGSARGDFDRDGLEDLLIVDYGGSPRLLNNRTRGANHWISIRLIGAESNRHGYGTRVEGRAGDDAIWIKHATPVSSYLSTSDPGAHFGLGDHERLDRLSLYWPSGQVDELFDVPCDQEITILEGHGIVARRPPQRSAAEE